MTARVVRAPRAGLADAAPRCSSQPGSDAIAGRGPAGRSADLSGPARPVPVAGWCGRPANMSLVMARATPRPRDTQPHPRALTRLVVRAPGRRPAAAPGLRSGMFLPAEVTRGAVITGEFRPDPQHQIIEDAQPPAGVYAVPSGHRQIGMCPHKP